MWIWIAGVALLALSLGAVWSDVRTRRIPNGLAVGAFLAGLIVRIPMGLEAVGGGLLAAGLAFGFGFVFFLLGGLGAGDVKLMAGLAAFVGLEGLLTAAAVMATMGILMALVATARQGVLGRTFRNLFLFFLTFGKESFRGWKGEGAMATLSRTGGEPVRSPYGVAVAAGAVAGWFAPLLGWSL